ncbi:MAG TPA: ubiquinone/menaquinone biosynthesis methyltransferase [Acidimicrobiia bacterium]
MSPAPNDTPTLPRADEKRAVVESMFDRVAPRYERVNRVISLGLDRGWRRAAIDTLQLPAGSRVLDAACGTGDLCRSLLASGHRAVGIDLSAGMLTAAHTDTPLVRADALVLPLADATLDGIVCGFALRNFVGVEPFFTECARVLRPGGRLVALDAAEPTNRFAKVGHELWFHRIVPWIGGLLSGDRAAYRYLPASTAYLPDGDALVASLRRSGFRDARRATRTAGAVQLLSGTREGGLAP